MSNESPVPVGSPEDSLHLLTRNQGVEPTSTLEKAPGSFKLKFFNNGNFVGWMGKDDKGWMCLTQNESEALNMFLYSHGGLNYYKLDNGKYLSYGGTYDTLCDHVWTYATHWDFKGNYLIAENETSVSYYSTDNGYLYANNGSKYTVLDVTRV